MKSNLLKLHKFKILILPVVIAILSGLVFNGYQRSKHDALTTSYTKMLQYVLPSLIKDEQEQNLQNPLGKLNYKVRDFVYNLENFSKNIIVVVVDPISKDVVSNLSYKYTNLSSKYTDKYNESRLLGKEFLKNNPKLVPLPVEYTMILLDHNLGDETGFDVLENLDGDYYQNRVVVVTGLETIHLAKQYAALGVIGHLIKPVSEVQFECAIEAALQRRNTYVDEKENWEQAYKILQNQGVLESISNLQADSDRIREQYEALKSIHEQLLADLKRAGERESALSQAYQTAGDALQATAGGITSILGFLNPFKITASFWSDVEYIFDSDRLQFFILQSYLQRIADNPLGFPVRHLVGGATGHYEYRIGRNYRLYFRREASTMILERYGNKNIQDKIIRFLDGTSENTVDLASVR